MRMESAGGHRGVAMVMDCPSKMIERKESLVYDLVRWIIEGFPREAQQLIQMNEREGFLVQFMWYCEHGGFFQVGVTFVYDSLPLATVLKVHFRS